jgi:hypothetical protein
MNQRQQKKSSTSKPKTTPKQKTAAKPYTQSSYSVITKNDIKLYNPKVVSTRKRIISA